MQKKCPIFTALMIFCLAITGLTRKDILLDFIVQHHEQLSNYHVRSKLLPHQIQISKNKERRRAREKAQAAAAQQPTPPQGDTVEPTEPQDIINPEEEQKKVAEGAAFRTIRQAAEDGYVPAQDLLAYCYATGTGTEKDEKLAFCWHLCTIFTGRSPAGIESLISCFERGVGVAKDLALASLLRAVLYPIMTLTPVPEEQAVVEDLPAATT